MPERRFGDERLASWSPTARARHVGLGPGLIDIDGTARIEPAPVTLAPRSLARTISFRGVEAFEAKPSARKNRDSIGTSALTPCSDRMRRAKRPPVSDTAPARSIATVKLGRAFGGGADDVALRECRCRSPWRRDQCGTRDWTARDTAAGRPKSVGKRGAWSADTVSED